MMSLESHLNEPLARSKAPARPTKVLARAQKSAFDATPAFIATINADRYEPPDSMSDDAMDSAPYTGARSATSWAPASGISRTARKSGGLVTSAS